MTDTDAATVDAVVAAELRTLAAEIGDLPRVWRAGRACVLVVDVTDLIQYRLATLREQADTSEAGS